MADYKDFKEIAHSGGKLHFDVVADGDGRLSMSSGFRHDRPVPSVIVGLYADLRSGEVVTTFRMGGIGDPFDPQQPPGCITVFLSSDSQGGWGHLCQRCRGYFRSREFALTHPTTCAYCGLRWPTHAFRTIAQRRYVAHIVEEVAACFEEIKPGEVRRVEVDMDKAADAVSTEVKPPFYYAEQSQQTEFNCTKCGTNNDVRGRFAYCCSCGWKNNGQDFRSSMERIREALNADKLSPASAIRDAVSEFDACCRDFAKQVQKRIPMKQARKEKLEYSFHNPDGAAITAMREVADVDLKRGFNANDTAFVTLMMHRRHVHEHHGGVADETYVKESGDPDARVGDLLRESKGKAHGFISVLLRMVGNLEKEFHEVFLPTAKPIERFEESQARTKATQKEIAERRGPRPAG